jgi:hypothetical protein
MEKAQKLTVSKSGVDLPHSENNGIARASVAQKRMTSRPVSTVSSSKWSVQIKIISNTVFVVGPAGGPVRPRKQHDYHHDTKVKPEAATAIIELLMMGGKTPETS